MKAIVCTKYGSPEVLQLQEIAKPTPRPREVLIKIFATAVTASDCIVRGFTVPIQFWLPMGLAVGFTKPRNPVLGLVLAGEIETVGQEVKRFQAGDQVYAFTMLRFGAYAEYIRLPENSVIAIKPSNLTYEEAAAIPFGGLMAWHYLKKGHLQSGQKVLLYGASGAIGTAAIQLAHYLGAAVTGVCSTTNIELVKSLGADEVIDYTQENFMERGGRYDLILNAVGKRKARLQCQKVLTSNGKYITVDDGNPTLKVEDLNLLTTLIEAGKFRAVIDRCYPLEQMVEAHRYVDKGHKKGNVVITVTPHS